MAKLQPTGLEWINKGLRDFIKDIEEEGKAVLASNEGLKEFGVTVDEFNKKSKEWAKTTGTVTRTTEGFTSSIKQTVGVVDQAGNVITKTSQSFKASDSAMKQSAGPTGGMAMFTKGISLLAVSIQLFLINALKDLLKWAVKSIVYLAAAPLRAVRDLAKLGFKFLVFAGQNAIEVLGQIGQAAFEMTEKIVRALIRITSQMFTTGKEIESAFAGILKASDGLVNEFGIVNDAGLAIRDTFLELGKITPIPVTEIMKIGELGAQLNISNEGLAEFSRVISAIVASTVLDAETAALGFGKIATVMRVSEEEFENLGSTVVWLGNNMGIVEDDLINMAKRITGVGVTAGMSADDILGISAAILRLGATPFAGASAVTQFVTKFIKEIQLGTDAGVMFAETAGMTVDQMKEAWAIDPASTFLNFIAGLSMAGDDAIVILDELGLANIRTSQTFLSLANSPELLIEALLGSRDAWKENEALTREASIRYATVESQLQMLKNQFSVFSTELFEKVKPVILAVINVAGRLFEALSPFVGKIFERLNPLIERAAGWITSFGNALLYATQIGQDGKSTWERFTQWILSLFNLDINIAGELSGTLVDVFETIKGVIGSIDFSAIWTNIRHWVDRAIVWFIENWPVIKEKGLEIINAIRDYDWNGLYETIIGTFQRAITWVKENWPTIKKTIIDVYNDIVDFLFGPKRSETDFGAMMGVQDDTRIGGFIDGFIEGFDNIKTAVSEAATAIKTEIVPAIQQTIKNLAVMLGGSEDMTAKEAGIFATEKIAEIIGWYTDLYVAIADIAELITSEKFQSAMRILSVFIPGAAGMVTRKGIKDLIEGGPGRVSDISDLDRSDLQPSQNPWSETATLINTEAPNISAANQNIITDLSAQWGGFYDTMVGNSLVPDLLSAMVTIFGTGLTEISALWESTFGVSSQFSMGGLLGIISRALPLYMSAGRSIIEHIATGMREAAYMMVDALKDNIKALQVSVSEDGDEKILGILFDIGEKIVRRIANAIIKSYQIILDALELAMSLGGQLVNQAAAAASAIANGASTAQASVIPTPAVPVPVPTPRSPTNPYGAPQNSTEVNFNPTVRSDFDMNRLENVVRRVLVEELS